MPPRQKLSYYDDPVAVGSRIKQARLAAGMSQKQLAFAGCTAAYVSRIEQGDRVPSLQILREFARRLGVGESYLAHGVEGESGGLPLTAARVALGLGEVAEARELIDAALRDARSDPERAAASALLGEVALYESEPVAAVEALERARGLDPSIERKDPAVPDALGRAYARAGEYEAAIGVFLRNFEGARERHDLVNKIRFGALLGNAYSDTGNFVAAEAVLGELLAEAGGLADPIGRARIYWAQSRMHTLKHDADSAARYAQRALEVLDVAGQTYYAALAHQLLAHIEVDRGNAERAVELLDEAAPLVEASGRPFERANLQLERARALMSLGKEEEAASLAMEAAGVLEHASSLDAGRGFSLIAKVFADLDDTDKAIELYELAIERLEAVPSRYLVEAYSQLAELYEQTGEAQRALELLRHAMRVQHDAGRLLAEH